MSCNITYTSLFEKEAKRLAKKYPSLVNEINSLINELKENPQTGQPLGKGLFKIRLAIGSKGKGKSGGARIITYLIDSDDILYLTSIYDKSEQDSIKIPVLLKILKEEGLLG